MSQTTTSRVVKVAELRGLADRLSQAFVSLRSAVGPTERGREADWVRRARMDLVAADCPRARPDDLERVRGLLSEVHQYLARAGL